MNEDTIVAVYDTAAHAEAAVRDLKAGNVPADAISQYANDTSNSTTGVAAREPGFWASLFGGEPDHDTSVYDRSIADGSTVVSVKVPAEHYERVSAILEKHNPIDIEDRAAQSSTSKTATTQTTTAPTMAARATDAASTARATDAASTDGTIQLAEETLAVGKRAVSGGTTRIRRYVVETPVEEQVSLHSEKVTLERRPVTDGAIVGTADFSDKTIEMTETSEEAVVSKTARVKEEIGLRKDVSDRVETVKDTVRRDEVKIEQVPGGDATSRTGEAVPLSPASPATGLPKI